MRSVRTHLRLALVVSFVAAIALAGPPKKKAPPAPAPVTPELHERISKALDEAEQKVGGCLLEGESGVVWTKTVKLNLSIDSAGNLVGSKVLFEPDDVSATTRKCVDDALLAVAFPKTNAPLTRIERTWTFGMR